MNKKRHATKHTQGLANAIPEKVFCLVAPLGSPACRWRLCVCVMSTLFVFTFAFEENQTAYPRTYKAIPEQASPGFKYAIRNRSTR